MSASAEVAGMVLRCARTGKLFFSEKDAKQHNEDTGFAEFEQVALEDKVWICSETGKVCVTETELELYKKRDPTAQTFEEKTVAYLREKHLESNRKPAAAVEGGSGDPMDVDATGSPAAEPQPVHIAEETVAQLKEMGFTRVRIERALVNTENGSLETAVNWLAEHGDDEDVDTPVGVPVLVVPQSEIDAHKAKTNLTQEEKQARLQAAVEAAQRKREEAEKADEKERERRRREDGKQMTKTKAELEELQRKRDLEARRKEKLEDQRHRAFLREQLERDKAERRAAREAKGLPAETPATKATQEPAAPEQPSPALANAAPPRPAEPVAVPVVPISEAITAVADNRDFLLETFVETTEKLADNVLKNPTEVHPRAARRLARAHASLARRCSRPCPLARLRPRARSPSTVTSAHPTPRSTSGSCAPLPGSSSWLPWAGAEMATASRCQWRWPGTCLPTRSASSSAWRRSARWIGTARSARSSARNARRRSRPKLPKENACGRPCRQTARRSWRAARRRPSRRPRSPATRASTGSTSRRTRATNSRARSDGQSGACGPRRRAAACAGRNAGAQRLPPGGSRLWQWLRSPPALSPICHNLNF